MIDDVSDIAAYYNNDPEIERYRLERNQLEYELTWRYLNQHLPSQGSILEIGAATGRYTLELAKHGYTITAVDLSAALIEQNRKVALKGAFDQLREGGIIFSSFISRFGTLGDLIKDKPGWIEDQAEVRSLLERGKRADDSRKGGFRGYFAQLSEIAPLHEAIGFETLIVAGVEPVISADDESYNKLQGKQRQLWLDLFYEISTEQSIMAASRHLLYVGQKRRR